MIKLVPGANDPGAQMPASWAGAEGDGRARMGRDKVWVAADVVLAVKVRLDVFEQLISRAVFGYLLKLLLT